MKIVHLVAAAALSACLAPAFAGNQSINLSSGGASFAQTSPVLQGGDDVISFTNLAQGSYQFILTLSGQNISNFAATFNGTSVPMTHVGKGWAGILDSTGTAPFALKLTGTPTATSRYSGELTVTAVPEPETYALMLAGLGVLGFVARRRRA